MYICFIITSTMYVLLSYLESWITNLSSCATLWGEGCLFLYADIFLIQDSGKDETLIIVIDMHFMHLTINAWKQWWNQQKGINEGGRWSPRGFVLGTHALLVPLYRCSIMQYIKAYFYKTPCDGTCAIKSKARALLYIRAVWMDPYLSCFLVLGGTWVHFLLGVRI